MRWWKPRRKDEGRVAGPLDLVQLIETGNAAATEGLDEEALSALRLLLPGDCVWPPELVRLQGALDRAREEPT